MRIVSRSEQQAQLDLVADLRQQVAWYKQENQKLLDRLLLKHNVQPVSQPLATPEEALKRIIESGDPFEEMSDADYEKHEAIERRKLMVGEAKS